MIEASTSLSSLALPHPLAPLPPYTPTTRSHILTSTPPDGARERPLQTITPLYTSLRSANPNVKLNTSISRDDAAKVANAAKNYSGPGNVLICWEHGQLSDIAKAIGVDPPPTYPKESFGIVWTIEAPYTTVNTPWGSEDGTPAVNGTGGLGQ